MNFKFLVTAAAVSMALSSVAQAAALMKEAQTVKTVLSLLPLR